MISPQINPKMKKKKELKTVDITVIVGTVMVFLISGMKSKDIVFMYSQNYCYFEPIPGLDGDSSSESQRSLGFGCQVPFIRQSAICNRSLEFPRHTTITCRLIFE